MAAGLILVDAHRGSKYTHIEDFFKKINCPSSIRGDFSKLRYWGLIEENRDEEGQEGYYKITPRGSDFVHGDVKVERNVLLFNNKMYGFKGAYVSIKDCLKNKFDYESLMSGTL